MTCALALGVALFASGCSVPATGEDQTTASVATGTTLAPMLERAHMGGTIAAGIEKEPDRAAEILAAHDITAEDFESLILEIAQDSLLTVTFEAAKVSAQ